MDRYNSLDDILIYRILRKIKKIFILILSLFFIMSSAVLFLILYLQSQPLPKTSIAQTSFVYSMDNEIIDALHSGESREYVPLSKIPQTLINATIAIEDRKFYKHFGFDFIRIGGVLIQNVKEFSKAQGASTITQQLARNLYLSHNKTWERKIKEALLAMQLELQHSKDKILEMYLNQIYFGHSANGIQLASKTYFDKDVSELSLAESSMLAGIPNGPSYFSPFIDFNSAKKRQKKVLLAMVSENYISQKEANEAYQTKLLLKNPDEKIYETKAPYFRDYIISIMKNDLGIDQEQIFQGGLKIYTTLDSKTQEYAEEIIGSYLPDDVPLQAALISIEPSTGFVKAMVGGREYKVSQYNRVFARRQPGSSFKPILYLAALESGFTPVTTFKSEPTVFAFGNNQTYQPSNFGDSYPNRDIDLRYALAHSDNIFAVKTHMEIGMDSVVNMSSKLGIDEDFKPYPSLALGSQEVTPFDMAQAYATIANSGKRIEPTAILKIENQYGNVIYEKKQIEEFQVVSPANSFILTYLMEGVFEPGGTGFYIADRIKRPIAGKTGTTDFDSWLIGYTPQLVTALWTGYDSNEPLAAGDSLFTKEIWADYMEKAHQSTSPQLFMVPEGVISLYIDPETGKIANESCPNKRLYVFREGTEPVEFCDIHPSHVSTDEIKENQKETSSPSFWSKFKYWWDN